MNDRQRANKNYCDARPNGCNKTALSLDALDAHTRELARNTYLTVNGKMLSCASFKVLENGRMQVEVMPEAFELINFNV